MTDAFEKMDRMYRFQRYFYDLTRKFYLLGRDRLINNIAVNPGDNILEIGCGTGRNLIMLAHKYPETNFYGLDASNAMLAVAQKNIEKARLKNITLRTALADNFSYTETFGMPTAFDAAFFSYSISMIPPWRESLDNALKNLRSAGKLYIVDFYDQKELPFFFQRSLKWWLSKFHVRFWDDLIPYLRSLEQTGSLSLRLESLHRRYAFIATIKKQ